MRRTQVLRVLLPSARARSHRTAGTNHAAHAQMADIDEVFLFPKSWPQRCQKRALPHAHRPYLLVPPRDWRRWLQGLRLRSHENGQQRQVAAASDMLPHCCLMQQAWQIGGLPRWRDQGRPVPLLESGVLRPGLCC